MNIINFNLIDDSEELKLNLVDDNEEINFSMTDYDDSEIKDEISNIKTQVNTNATQIAQNKADIEALDDRVDQIPIITKTSQLTNDSGFITSDYHDSTKQDTLISGTNIKTINGTSVLGSGNIQIDGVTDYEELNNLPSINNVELKGNKTSSDLGMQPAGDYALRSEIPDVSDFITKNVNDLVNYYLKSDTYTKSEVNNLIGSIENHFQYVTLSEDISNPTNIFNYANSSGLYVAKNNGFIGTETGEDVLTALAEGQFFSVFNFKNFEDIIGEEIPDENNIIKIEVPGVENYNYIFYKSGTDDWKQISTINSENISGYLPSESYIKESAINMTYGLNFVNGYLSLYEATETAIRTGKDQYHAITPRRGQYLVEYWGDQKYTTKTEFAELQSEIEDILDTVVSVNE